MPNPQVANLIAQGLAQGLKHPGDPERNISPSVIKLPGFNTSGMSPEQAEKFLGSFGQLFGEAIVYLIENTGGYQIVAKTPTPVA